MNVDEVYTLWKYIIAKNLQDGYASPEDFNLTINQGERSYTDYLCGEYQKYRDQRPIPVVSFSETERVKTSLAPLVYGTVLAVNSITGIAPYPSDFEIVDSMWSVYGNYNIRFSQQTRLDSFVHSTIDPIENNPIYLIQHEGFHFFPENIGSARMAYIRTPPYMVWRYNEDSNGIPVYDPINSVQPIWSDLDIFQIITRALSIVGVNLQFPMVMQYANEIKNNGQ